MEPTKLILLEETGFVQRELRRYCGASNEDKCTGPLGYHNASKPIDTAEVPANDTIPAQMSASDFGREDFRWPEKCACCAYRFTPEDEWQVSARRIYRRADNNDEVTLDDAPVGSLWWAWWLAGVHESDQTKLRGGGGPHLMLKTPGGEWDIDAPSSKGSGWARLGTPPLISVTPSIRMPTFHGVVENGILREI